MSRTCKTCLYSTAGDIGTVIIECRHKSPTGNREEYPMYHPNPRPTWPIVREDHWCGDWEARQSPDYKDSEND